MKRGEDSAGAKGAEFQGSRGVTGAVGALLCGTHPGWGELQGKSELSVGSEHMGKHGAAPGDPWDWGGCEFSEFGPRKP